MNNKDIDAQFLCKDCTRYNLCEYYHRRRKDSYICKYFHLSVTPQEPRWIPCSEKKPNKGGEYLLWGKICDDDEEEYCFLGDYYEFEEKFGIEKSNYDPHTLGFLDTEIEEYYSVVAWMPLPKAYGEVEE